MLKHFITLILFFSAYLSLRSQDTIWMETFDSGTGAWTLNTTSLSSAGTSGYNEWIINNFYSGGSSAYFDCSVGVPTPYSMNSTDFDAFNLPGGFMTNYLHILSDTAKSDGILSSNFWRANGGCYPNEKYTAEMNIDINTGSYTGVSLSFWWNCGGSAGISYGEVFYSTNSGSSWTAITTPITQYTAQSAWVQQTISLAAFSGAPSLRFAFRFTNNSGGTVNDPGFSIDRIVLSGNIAGVISTGSLSSDYCPGDTFSVPYTASGSFSAGNFFTAQLSDMFGSFGSPVNIGNVMSTTSGTITAVIPLLTPAGGNYRIRVVGSTPPITGSDNGSDVIINQLPVGGSATAVNDSVCTGETMMLTLLAYSGFIQWQSSPDGFAWSNISGATSDTYTTPVLTANTYYRAAVMLGSCGPVYSSGILITVTPLTVAGTASADKDSICSGDFTGLTVSGYTGNKLQWQYSFDGISFTSSPGSTFPVISSGTLTANTWFRCIVRSGTCDPDTTNAVQVHIVPKPTADFTWSLTGGTISCTDLSTAANNWFWDFGDGTGTSTDQNPVYNYPVSGTYSVTLYACFGDCCDTLTQSVGLITQRDEPNLSSGILVFPNPAKDFFRVQFNSATPGTYSFALTGTDGKEIALLKENVLMSGAQTAEFKLATPPSGGVYLLKVSGPDGVRAARILFTGAD